jgi:hypothetical protein
MAEDIYPLGQDKGLLTDIANFGLNNLYQFSQSFGDTNRRISSVMGDIAAGRENPDTGPLMRDLLNVSPGAFAGTWGPIRTGLQKQAVRGLWRHNPEDVLAVAKDPDVLNLTVPKPNVETAKAMQDVKWMPEGATAAFEPVRSELRVAPATMVGGHYQTPMTDSIFERVLGDVSTISPELQALRKRLTTPRIETRPGGTTDLPEAMGHEATHFLNRNRAYGTQQLDDAAEIAESLAPYLSDHAVKSALEGGLEHKNPGVVIDEMLAYLSGKSTRNAETENIGRLINQFLKVRTGPTGNVASNLSAKSVQAAIRMAHEAADPVYGKVASAQWDKLAKEGTLPLREGYYKAETPFNKAFPDNPLFSMRQRTEPASMYDKLPRAGRTFTSAEDIIRGQAGEQLPPLGSAMPDIPRPVSSPGGLDFFENLRAKLGLPAADLGGMAPEFYGKKTPGLLEARIRHGTDPESALGIIREGLKPGSSISKRGGLDYEGYPVTLEFEDALRGAKDYSSPLGPTMHEGAAKIGESAKDLRRVFFDPNEYLYKEDALSIFRKLREGLNATGRKGTKIERQAYNEALDKYEYGGTPSLKGMKTFEQRASEVSDKQLQRMFDDALDSGNEPRITAAIEEMTKRNPELLKSKRGGQALDEIYQDWVKHSNDPRAPRTNVRGQFLGPQYGTNVTKDSFMTEVMSLLSQATRRGGTIPDLSQGLSGFRRNLGPVENLMQNPTKPLDPLKTLDILDHLREHGLMEPEALEKALSMGGQVPFTNESGLNRLKGILDRVGYDPTTGATKGNPDRLLKSKAGGKALNEIFDNWKDSHATITGESVIPNDRFMDEVLNALAQATQRHMPLHRNYFPRGISGFRRDITTGENKFNMRAAPHDAQKTLDILEHLRDYGFMEPGVLEKALESKMMENPLPRGPKVDPKGLEFIKRLLERTGR